MDDDVATSYANTDTVVGRMPTRAGFAMTDPVHPPPVSGVPTSERCPQCRRNAVLLTYQRRASRVFYCTACGHVWVTHGPQQRDG